jgi:septum formation protein
MTSLYLASKSPRRMELLRQAGIAFELLPLRETPTGRCEVDETPLPGEAPDDYVQRVTRLKAEAGRHSMMLRRLPERLILAADTTVTLDRDILGKPANDDEAVAMLSRLSGRTHTVLTAIAIAVSNDVHCALSRSEVTFGKLDEGAIRQYVATGESMDKAGAYAIQGRAAGFIEHLSGSYSGVMGLPLYETMQLLRHSGMTDS